MPVVQLLAEPYISLYFPVYADFLDDLIRLSTDHYSCMQQSNDNSAKCYWNVL